MTTLGFLLFGLVFWSLILLILLWPQFMRWLADRLRGWRVRYRIRSVQFSRFDYPELTQHFTDAELERRIFGNNVAFEDRSLDELQRMFGAKD